ncbi:MAG: LysM peptidoglycan-binding domain-containing protein [Pseudomonadota bacterium]
MSRISSIATGAGVAALLVVALLAMFSFVQVGTDEPSSASSVRPTTDEDTAASDAVEPDQGETAAASTEEETPDPASNVAPVEQADATPPVANPANQTPQPPDFDVVRIDGAGRAVVAGRASPDQDVTLRVDGREVASVRADDQGNFVSFFDVPQSEAPQILSLESIDDSGAVQAAEESVIVAPAPETSSEPVEPEIAAIPDQSDDFRVAADDAPEIAATIDAQPPESQTADANDDDASDNAPTVTAEAAPSAAPRLFQTGPQGLRVLSDGDQAPDVRTDLGIDAITYNAQGEVQLTGRAGEGAELRIYLDNRPVQDVQADGGGAWASQLPDVPPGVYTLRVDAIQPDGQVMRRIETPFERTDPTLAAALAAGAEAITVQPGFTLWAISEGHFGDGIQYVQIFEANRDLIRDPDLIYPGQVFALPDPG